MNGLNILIIEYENSYVYQVYRDKDYEDTVIFSAFLKHKLYFTVSLVHAFWYRNISFSYISETQRVYGEVPLSVIPTFLGANRYCRGSSRAGVAREHRVENST